MLIRGIERGAVLKDDVDPSGGPPGREGQQEQAPASRRALENSLDELPRPGVLGTRQDGLRRTLLDNDTPVHEQDPVPDLAREPKLVGDHDHRHSARR